MLGAYTRWFNEHALLLGWAVGMAVGTGMAIASHLTPTYALHLAGYSFPGYSAFYTVILNTLVALVFTPIFNALSSGRVPLDETAALDYQV